MNKKNYKHIFFDLDGTLLDTLGDIVNAINLSLLDIGIDHKYSYEEGKKLIGMGSDEMARRSLAPFKTSEEKKNGFLRSFLANYEKYQADTTYPFPDVLEGLKSLKENGFHLYIISNKPDKLSQIICTKRLDVSVFDIIIGKRDGYPTKPDPCSFNETIEKFSLNKDEILYVGDSKIDVEFSLNTGVDSAILKYGYAPSYEDDEFKKATYMFGCFKELVNFLLD